MQDFSHLIAAITAFVGRRPLDACLERDLNRAFPPHSLQYESIFAACKLGVASKTLCTRETGGSAP